ncbi:hypothetical protein BDY19DRAFT_1052109 [Irpex rosettiformis]|uniref:Uncharacterized protein n=1 Tax=Irpex rosettiformis TaxID=378272 RepID=A0ACB8UIS7_9APHY|nr:hypothetical protein BDY19DRAFT_1052109 [Irpex rosettiformis]
MSLMLANLATTIVAEVPVLIERTLKQDEENTLLQHQCAQLKVTIDDIQRRIDGERVKQHKLRIQLLRIRGPPSSRSGSIRELRTALQPSNLSTASPDDSIDGSFTLDGSPISLKSKRKGIVFDDNFRLPKRMRLSVDGPAISQ